MNKVTVKLVAKSHSDLLGLRRNFDEFLDKHKNVIGFWSFALNWAMNTSQDTDRPARIEIEFDHGKGEISKFSSAHKKELEPSCYLEFTRSWK